MTMVSNDKHEIRSMIYERAACLSDSGQRLGLKEAKHLWINKGLYPRSDAASH
ncbi:hypothetical protein QQX98_005559 [Neonectria punicea]|uniref:Uncharacterized protein n=1 Tax=Neonectria punicea TaxID=979145 RepID=A0ABR1H429_9HYPO